MTSDEVTLTIGSALAITKQPVNTTAAAGSQFTMSVTANSTNVNYEWQYYYQGKWNSFQNSNSATLTKTANKAWNGWKIRVIVSDKNNANTKVTSDEVTLTIGSTLAITKQPVNTTAAAGSQFTMSVTANSTNVNYEWQYYYQGKWNSFQNSNSATLTKTANKAWNGWKIRVIVSDKNNANTKVTSDEVTLTIGAALTITNQPVDTTVAAGSEFTMSVTASSTNVNYDWQYFYQGKWNSFQNTNSATLTKTAKSAWNGWKIRVIVSDKNNANTKVASDEVTLTVISNIVIDDVTYKKLADGTYEVVSYSGSASSLTIPAKVENADVTKIGEEAFLNKTSLTSISLPNSITVIGARAFKGCTNLGQMTTHD